MLGRQSPSHGLPLLLVALMLSSLMVWQPPALADDASVMPAGANTEEYDLYFVSPPSGHSDEGLISTERPESGGQEELSATSSITFSTHKMLSDLTVHGDREGSVYELEIRLFIQSVGPEGSTADWSVSLIGGSAVIGTVDWTDNTCTVTWSENCNSYSERTAAITWSGAETFEVPADQRISVVVSVDMNCNSGGGGPGGPPETEARQLDPPGGNDCDGRVAFNEIESTSNRFSKMEIETNPLEGSVVKIHRPGAVWTDAEVLDWFPNDTPENREMMFNIQVNNAFGRDDVNSIRLILISFDNQTVVNHLFDEADITVDSNALRATFNWTYTGDLDSGDYRLEMEIVNVQSRVFIVEHEDIRMRDYGVALTHADDRLVEYIAPGKTTPITFDLRHIGAGSSLTAELSVWTSLGTDWGVAWDRGDATYNLSTGGQTVHPILTLMAPADLSGSPDHLEIRVQAEDIDSVVVHQTTLQLDLEKLDTYAPPMASIWNEPHSEEYANSSRAEDFDTSIPRYVENGEFTTFWLEIFNTGFDTDAFRIDVVQDSKANVQFWDNDTGARIDVDEGDGTFHTPNLDRHTTQVIKLRVKPSVSRDDPDVGNIDLEIISIGNATQKAEVSFTIQRTFGVQAEVVYDCDSTPFGHVVADVCEMTSDSLAYQVEITNSLGTGDQVTEWRIVNPAMLERNINEDLYEEANAAYELWQYSITDADGDSVVIASLAPDDSITVDLDITLTKQVVQGNHTIYLRVIENIEDESVARYFDLPLTIEVGKDDPDLAILQISSNVPMQPETTWEVQMKVRNDGNSEVTVILDADTSGDWKVEIQTETGSNALALPAFSEETFSVLITAPASANNGDEIPIELSATPFSVEASYPDSVTAEKTLVVQVALSDPVSIILNEITNPRPLSIVVLVGAVVLFAAWISGRRNRVEYVDEWVEEDEEEDEEDLDLPAAVEADDDGDYDEDDIELIDLD